MRTIEGRGRTVEEAVANVLSAQSPEHAKGVRLFSLSAPSGNWSPWKTVWSQLGADADRHRRVIRMRFAQEGATQSAFGIQIEGGDDSISSHGPGTETVVVSGNVATSVRVRVRSFSVRVHVRLTVID